MQTPEEAQKPRATDKPADHAPEVRKEIKSMVSDLTRDGYHIAEADDSRPWGGSICLGNVDAKRFAENFFGGVNLPEATVGAELTPRLLVVQPGKQLPWQAHHIHGGTLRVMSGLVSAYVGDTDTQTEKPLIYGPTEVINVPVGAGYRLVGLDKMGIVAEI